MEPVIILRSSGGVEVDMVEVRLRPKLPEDILAVWDWEGREFSYPNAWSANVVYDDLIIDMDLIGCVTVESAAWIFSQEIANVPGDATYGWDSLDAFRRPDPCTIVVTRNPKRLD